MIDLLIYIWKKRFKLVVTFTLLPKFGTIIIIMVPVVIFAMIAISNVEVRVHCITILNSKKKED